MWRSRVKNLNAKCPGDCGGWYSPWAGPRGRSPSVLLSNKVSIPQEQTPTRWALLAF